MIMYIVVRALLIASTVLGLGAAPAVLVPTFAATAAAQDVAPASPGDGVLLHGRLGTVDASGRAVTWDDGAPSERWNSGMTVEDVLAAGGTLLPRS
jgi:hypothetical protein